MLCFVSCGTKRVPSAAEIDHPAHATSNRFPADPTSDERSPDRDGDAQRHAEALAQNM
jgi:hypothetical protein